MNIQVKQVYKGKFISVYEEYKPNGDIYEKAFFKNTAHVFPITKEGEILFIEEFREEYGKYKILLPSGVVDQGENFEKAALREMEEEIGYATNEPLIEIATLKEKGSINYERKYFLAENVYALKNSPKEEQIRSIQKIKPEDLLIKCINGDFGMSKSVLAYIEFCKYWKKNNE